MLVAFFGFQTSKNGSPGEQWPDHLRDVNCVRNVTRRAFKNTTRDFIVTNRDGWRVWSHLSRKSLCQAWDLKKKKKKPTNSGVQRVLSSAVSKSHGKDLGTSFASAPFFGEVIGHLRLSDGLPG